MPWQRWHVWDAKDEMYRRRRTLPESRRDEQTGDARVIYSILIAYSCEVVPFFLFRLHAVCMLMVSSIPPARRADPLGVYVLSLRAGEREIK